MSAHRWATIEPATDADLRKVVTLISGAEFRAKGGVGAARGTVGTKGGALVLQHRTGLTEALSASACAGLEFAISEEAFASAIAPTAGEPDRLAILAACPPWARRTVAAHLMPSELAAFDKAERDARIARIKQSAALAQGKVVPTGAETTSPEQARRAEQLRQIGRAASAGGNR